MFATGFSALAFVRVLGPLAALGLLFGCTVEQPEDELVNEGRGTAPAAIRPVAQPEPALNRERLLAAVAAAGSAKAAGMDDNDTQRLLEGRRFEFRIRFGCSGPAEKLRDAPLGWAFNAENSTLRLRAQPTISIEDPLVRAVSDKPFEAVEGFWIPRPWLLQAVCPAAAAVSPALPEASSKEDFRAQHEPAPGAAAPRIGIAQFFSNTDPRTSRRSSRAYEAVKTLSSAQPLGSQGFDLVLSGRLRALAGRRVIACATSSPDTPPDCIISAEFDRVWVEHPDTAERIAEWSSS